MNDKLNLEVTIKPALTVERIREELADMCGLPINDETRAEIVRRLNAIGLFDFSVEAKPTCTDERPCVNCFSGQGECEVGPFGGPELLEQARALCQAIERLPAGEHQTNLISKIADATFALQNLQSTGDYFWPRPVAPELTEAAKDVLAEQDRLSKIASAELVKAQPGDLVVFRAAAGSVTADDVNAMRKYLNVLLPPQIKSVIVVGDLEISSMSEEQLKQVGLVRVGSKESDDLTQFLEQTDFDAAEKVASDTVANQRELPAGEDDCEGCKI